MKIYSLKRQVHGTTMVDVVAAMVILAIMVGALMGSFSYGFFMMQLARENQRATQILLEKAETIRLYRWDQVNTPGFIPDTFTDVYDPQAPDGSQGITYNGTVSISNVTSSASYADNLRQLTINLQWTTARNFARSRTLSTLIAKDGIQNYVY